MAITFDTLRASQRLRDTGVPEDQAQAIVATISDSVPEDVVTNAVLKAELRALEQRMTIRLLATVGGGVGIVLAGMGVATAVILEAN